MLDFRSAISEVAAKNINQVIHIVTVTVDNLDVSLIPCTRTTIVKADSANHFYLSNSGMSTREPAGDSCSTMSTLNRRLD